MCVTSSFLRRHRANLILGLAAIDRMSTVPRWTAACQFGGRGFWFEATVHLASLFERIAALELLENT
jgi:hypothetical protein